MRGRNNNNNNNNNNNRKGPNPLTRNYESNGPDVKIRGSAQQIAEKYATLARDAQSAGDRVMAENYLQHAEHYNRIIAAAQAQMPIQQQARDNRDELDEDIEDDMDVGQQEIRAAQPQQQPQPKAVDGSGPQPVIEGMPAEVALNQEQPAEVNGIHEANANGTEPAAGEEEAPARRPRRPRRPRRTAEVAEQANAGESNGNAETSEAPSPEASNTEAVAQG